MERYIGRQPQGNAEREAKTSTTYNVARTLKDIGALSLSYWYWFALSLAVAFAIAFYYLKSTPNVYERTVSILIKTGEGNTDPILDELGIQPVSGSLANEMELMRTETIAYEIARRLNLNVQYFVNEGLKDRLLYSSGVPVKVDFIDLSENQGSALTLDLDGDGKLKLYDFSAVGDKPASVVTAALGDTVDTPAGRIVVTASKPDRITPVNNLQVKHLNIANVANSIKGGISPKQRGKTSIIDISYRDVSPQRAEDILNTLIGVYNENWMKDRNLRTLNTDKFIRERLAFIENELGDVEKNISTWKSENLILDVDAEGARQQNLANEAQRQLEDIEYQKYMTKTIREYLTDGKHDNQLLPANSGITNSNIEKLIGEYNNLLLERNNHLANSSLRNPLVQDLDERLGALRGSMLQSMDYELSMLDSKTASVRSQRGAAVSKIAANPLKAQQLLSVERQQKVKEDLYLYLLQRREENELSQAFAAYNNQFIEAPHGSGAPVEPVSRKIYLIALAVGLLVPTVVISGKELLTTTVRGRKDLETLSVPYAGDLPQMREKKKASKKKPDETPKVVVVEKNRNYINEAFRVVRTNMEFLLGFGKSHEIIMVTSLNPGSGKTFITANLSTALAIRGKKVLVIDLDLRKGSLSKYVDSPKHGISNYLSGQVDSYRNLIVEMGKVSVLPCGTLPPNPAELLFSDRFKELMEEVKAEYDYVFLDCPPVEVVADASIIAPYANLTLFVVRVGHLEREQLADVENWYHDKKFGNLAVLLNGVDQKGSRYGYHKYGYHYGSYGYGYGD